MPVPPDVGWNAARSPAKGLERGLLDHNLATDLGVCGFLTGAVPASHQRVAELTIDLNIDFTFGFTTRAMPDAIGCGLADVLAAARTRLSSRPMAQTFYRRPLPSDAISFSSPEGRRIFAEALEDGGLEGYFRLAEQFHTQADPAYCGLGSLVMALNALSIDPGRLWKGPWRWFGEEQLDCCVPLEEVRLRGLDLDELACLARCNGAAVTLRRTETATLDSLHEALAVGARAEAVVVAAYDRGTLGQSGSGHFSPIAGYHRARDLALILDVARFKYPPHWVSIERLYAAMQPVDAATGKSRGWLLLRSREHGTGLGFTVKCEGESWHGLARRVNQVVSSLDRHASIAELARAVAPLVEHLELRTPSLEVHQRALDQARAQLHALPAYAEVAAAVGSEHAETVLVLLLVVLQRLPSEWRDELKARLGGPAEDSVLAAELNNVSAQYAAVAALERSP